VGVLKMRDPLPKRRGRNHRKSISEGMEWDDTDGMNIIVNPLEDVEKNDGGKGSNIINNNPMVYSSEGEEDEEEEESSDDGGSYHEEDELTEDDDEEAEHSQVLPLAENSRQGLEWDDSTLTTPGNNNNTNKGVTKTYHV